MIKIKVLIENETISKKLKNKHGLSIYINTGERQIILDSGPDGTFMKNGEIMGINFAEIDYLFLSHSHIDHTGGTGAFSKINTKAKIFLFDNPDNKYFSKIFRFFNVPIGFKADNYTKKRILQLADTAEIAPNIWFVKNSENNFSKSTLNSVLYKKTGDSIENDSFEHEGILVIKEEGELVIFSSCSHSGVRNIVESVRKKFPDKKIRSFVGGFHLCNPINKKHESDEKLKIFLDEIDATGIKFYTGHCTGEYAYQYLKKNLGNKIDKINTGTEIVV